MQKSPCEWAWLSCNIHGHTCDVVLAGPYELWTFLLTDMLKSMELRK